MTAYDIYLLVHVAAAIVWVGGATVIQIQGGRILRSGDGARLAAFAKDAEFVGMRFFLPAGLLVVGFGFALLHEGGWAYSAWVVFALAAYAASFLTGALFLGPESGRIAATIEAEGADSPEATHRIRRIMLVSRIELSVLWAIVAAMALKPTLGDAVVLAAGAVALALAIGAIVWRHLSAPAAAAAPETA